MLSKMRLVSMLVLGALGVSGAYIFFSRGQQLYISLDGTFSEHTIEHIMHLAGTCSPGQDLAAYICSQEKMVADCCLRNTFLYRVLYVKGETPIALANNNLVLSSGVAVSAHACTREVINDLLVIKSSAQSLDRDASAIAHWLTSYTIDNLYRYGIEWKSPTQIVLQEKHQCGKPLIIQVACSTVLSDDFFKKIEYIEQHIQSLKTRNSAHGWIIDGRFKDQYIVSEKGGGS